MKLVFILVDALKSSYLNADNMPFLYALIEKSSLIEKIYPSPGFCERSEIFTGLDSYDTGNYSAIGYLPNYSSYGKWNILLRLIRMVSNINPRIGFHLTRYYCLFTNKQMRPYRIPISILSHYALTEDGDKRFTNYNTIFDSLDAQNKTYTLRKFASLSGKHKMSSMDNLSFLVKSMQEGVDFIPIYFGDIDKYGHKYGGDLAKMKIHLNRIDDSLRELYNTIDHSKYYFSVLGDHGMVPIVETVNIYTIISDSSFKLNKDYEIFIDSTTVRFWCKSIECKNNIESLLDQKLSNKGLVINESNYQQYRIPLDIMHNGKRVYGDLVWIANPGVLLVPDYFNTTSPYDKGMHGYLKIDDKHGTGLFIISGGGIEPKKIGNAPLYKICDELCKYLSIPKPNNETWERIIC